ncbi:ribosomal protein [Hirsutella rhossiliensis]|uniref:Ribosomal protein l1p/L10e family domain-containing protein n=1 Tax=Hirsutella rhossiliensis TaxID=111463 RepID=A0A9P8MTQ3_9HYPO|nr:ribosomal protein l1p/L10e family domain-containing protein [Hirsutella rhossiliensis]KAH0961105.1 ribosomal protein l1p/L10e family domain-containing protein [Hirsutella rhossiliensis]
MAPPSKEVVAAGSSALTRIDPDQTLKASKALLAHIKKAARQQQEGADGKRNLLQDDDDDVDDDTPVWLTLTTKRHIADKARLQPGKIALPHPLVDEAAATTVCAITADPQRAYKNLIGSDDFPAALRRRITRVIDLSKLKAKYGQYEAQRKLFAEHDVFVADDRIINRLPKMLGKTFYKTTVKRPIPVVLQAKRPKVDGKRVKRPEKKKSKTDDDTDDVAVNAGTAADIAKEIEKALGSALVSLAPTTNTAVRVGYAHWPPEHIADNVDAVVSALVDRWVPQKWRNVKSIYIKGPRTAALPIWQTDELWLGEGDVVADQDDDEKAGSEKANVGKKRKSLDAAGAADASPAPKKKKKEAKPDGDDEQLDKQITERKAKLKKQKAAAKKAMEE